MPLNGFIVKHNGFDDVMVDWKPTVECNGIRELDCEVGTPVPIPNTEVNPGRRTDGTARVAVWESRSPPGIIIKKPRFQKWKRGFLR